MTYSFPSHFVSFSTKWTHSTHVSTAQPLLWSTIRNKIKARNERTVNFRISHYIFIFKTIHYLVTHLFCLQQKGPKNCRGFGKVSSFSNKNEYEWKKKSHFLSMLFLSQWVVKWLPERPLRGEARYQWILAWRLEWYFRQLSNSGSSWQEGFLITIVGRTVSLLVWKQKRSH